jgi:murein L,D-transpeptidase YcbB/YkuD
MRALLLTAKVNTILINIPAFMITVVNSGLNTLDVYPATGEL